MQNFGFDDSESRDEVLTKTILEGLKEITLLTTSVQMDVMRILNYDTDSALGFIDMSSHMLNENRQYLASVVGVPAEDCDAYFETLRQLRDMLIMIRNFRQQLFTTFLHLEWVQAFNIKK